MSQVRVIFDITNMVDTEATKIQTTLAELNGVGKVEMIHPHGPSHDETHEFWVNYDPDRTHVCELHQALEHNGYRNFAVGL